MDRKFGDHFGDEKYSREELIAEIGASILCEYSKTENHQDNSIAYIKSWIKELKNDKRMILYAASHAEKAIEYILGGKDGITRNVQ